MADEEKKVVTHINGRFAKGHPQFGGRKKGVPDKRRRTAMEIAARHEFDPVELMIIAIKTGALPNADGSETVIETTERVKLLREVAQYLSPKVHSIALTGDGGGPIQHAVLDIAELMKNPALASAAETLSLGMVHQAGIEPVIREITGDFDAERCDD